jgi:hypothetical protein
LDEKVAWLEDIVVAVECKERTPASVTPRNECDDL